MTKAETFLSLSESIQKDADQTTYTEKSSSFHSSPVPEKTEETQNVKKPNKTWIILGLLYVNFWAAACMSLQAPFFPKEAELKGASPTVYGFIFGIYELFVFISSPFYAKIMPPVKPKSLVIGGLVLEGVSVVGFGLLDLFPPGNLFIAMAFVTRIFEGLAAAAIMTCSFTIISIEFRESVATPISTVETAFGFGLIAGPSIGGFLYQIGGFLLPFAVCGICILSSTLLILFTLPQSEKSEPNEDRNFKEFIFNCDVILYLMSVITALLLIGFNSATLEPHLRVFELKPSILGLIFVISGGMYALTTPLWGRLCDKGIDPHLICIFGYTLVVIGLIFQGPLPFLPIKLSLPLVIFSLVITGFGFSAKCLTGFVGSLKNANERGFPDNVGTYAMISALFSCACSLGAFIGPTLGGFLLDTIGYENGTIVVIGVELFFLIVELLRVFVGWRRKRKMNLEKMPLLSSVSLDKKTLTLSK